VQPQPQPHVQPPSGGGCPPGGCPPGGCKPHKVDEPEDDN
jgi:hypothetical protein